MLAWKKSWTAMVGLVAVVGASLAFSAPQSAEAANAADFDPGFIISDSVFFNANAMGEAEIQSFLRSQLPSCAQSLGVACLPNYTETTNSRAATSRCAAYSGAANEPASRIINRVAKACGINPQVLIVTLQKENGLVTKGSPSAGAYRTAMGYACPDTAACDSAYFGFFNQVYSAASQFIRYGVTPTNWRYRPGQVAVQFHPNAACGSTVVNIANQATANLYNYTPYQPNAAALANLGGTGDSCSSYGNRNFWVYFSNWFGSPTGKVNPIGSIDSLTGSLGEIQVRGWALDPDTTGPIDVHVYIDGVGVSVTADKSRPDVGASFPASGPNHGYSASFPVTRGGAHDVCMYAINFGPGATQFWGCRTVNTPTGAPIGHVDTAVASVGKISVSGWAIDPDTAAQIPVHVYVDAASVGVTANKPRSDAGAAYPAYGASHGFTHTVDATPGEHRVCVYGIDVLGGHGATLLNCQTVIVPSVAGTIPEQGRAPLGAIDTVTATTGQVSVAGWALDPDTASSISVHVYVDSASVGVVADGARADIGARYPGYGDNHGFTKTMAAAPGNRQVCAYAIDSVRGAASFLGCLPVTVPAPPEQITEKGRMPVGAIDSAKPGAGQIVVTGWALDPDTVAPISVHVYVDSASVGVVANLDRPDIATRYPGYGANHGFTKTMPATPGVHQVCAYGINSGPGGATFLGCVPVTVPNTPGGIQEQGRLPVGHIDSAAVSGKDITVSGWALDPDTTAAIDVHVYVDSVSVGVKADSPRPDVGAAYPAYGPNHGFSKVMTTTSGSHQVCAYGINSGPGGAAFLGCLTVVVP
jgi:hypothetical protein